MPVANQPRRRAAHALLSSGLVAGALLASAGTALAADPSTPDPVFEVETDTTPSGTCTDYGDEQLANALRTGGSTVDGGSATLNGVPADACETTVNLTSYELPGGELEPFDEQRQFQNTTVTIRGGDDGRSVSVGTPDCAWQVDLYTGAVNPNPPHTPERLVDFDTNTASDNGAEPCDDDSPGDQNPGGENPGGENTETDNPDTQNPDDDSDVSDGGDENPGGSSDVSDGGANNPGNDNTGTDDGANNNPGTDDSATLAQTGIDAGDIALTSLWLMAAGGLVLWDLRRTDGVEALTDGRA